MDTSRKTIRTAGNYAVVINGQDGDFWACLYTNARNGLQDATICHQRWVGKTLAGAERWAAKQLEAATA